MRVPDGEEEKGGDANALRVGNLSETIRCPDTRIKYIMSLLQAQMNSATHAPRISTSYCPTLPPAQPLEPIHP